MAQKIRVNAEGMPQFDEKSGPFALVGQFIDFAWVGQAFDAERLEAILTIASMAYERAALLQAKPFDLPVEIEQQRDSLSKEDKRKIIRRKTLYAAALDILNDIRLGESLTAPMEELKIREEDFWENWIPVDRNNEFYGRICDDVTLSDGASNRNNRGLNENIIKSLADAAGLPKKEKIITSPPLQANPVAEGMLYGILIERKLFKKLESRFHNPGRDEREK